jgi:hypothetical protein
MTYSLFVRFNVLKPEVHTNQFLDDLKRLATLFDD